MSEYRPVSHVVFDMDGLLLDTEELYSKAYQNVLAKNGSGETYTFEFKARNILGRKPAETSAAMVEHYKLPITPEEFLEALENEFEVLFPHTTWMPGVLKLLHHLYKNKIPMAVATSSGSRQFERKAASHRRLFGFFGHVVKGADVAHGKPAPDIYLRAAQLFGGGPAAPRDCLAFEDAPSGVASASSAGMQVVMIPDERMPEDLRREATLIIVGGTAHSFRPELFGLPPFAYSPVRCVLFDVDGLMLDTTRMYDEVNKVVVEGQGKKFDRDFHRKLKGMRWPENARKMIEHYGLPDEIPGVFASSNELLAKLLVDCVMLPGVERLVRHLKAKGIPIAVATSGARGNFEIKTSKHREIFDMFDETVCGGSDPEVKGGKPAPDVFLVTAKRLSADPAQCLVLEDAANGAAAAAAAGMQCVLVPERGEWAEPEETLAATQLLATLEDFRPEDFGLPAFC